MDENSSINPELKDKLLNYVKLDYPTEYAILITGAWGSGKTFFIKEEIFPKIESKNQQQEEEWFNQFHSCEKIIYGSFILRKLLRIIPINNNIKKIATKAPNKTIPVYISLYGLKSKQQIRNTILSYLTFNISNNLQNLLGNEVKQSLESLSKYTRTLSNVAVYFLINKVFKTNCNLVLFFDDLERIDGNLKEIMGEINYYVEHNNIKTIIICNEEQLKNRQEIQKEIQEYEQVKEKVVGVSNSFLPDNEKLFENILANLKEKGFYKNLEKIEKENKQLKSIIEKSKCNNIRSLKRAFLDCCDFLEKEIIIKDHSLFSKIIKFIFIINIESELSNGFKDQDKKYFFEENIGYRKVNYQNTYDLSPQETEQKKYLAEKRLMYKNELQQRYEENFDLNLNISQVYFYIYKFKVERLFKQNELQQAILKLEKDNEDFDYNKEMFLINQYRKLEQEDFLITYSKLLKEIENFRITNPSDLIIRGKKLLYLALEKLVNRKAQNVKSRIINSVQKMAEQKILEPSIDYAKIDLNDQAINNCENQFNGQLQEFQKEIDSIVNNYKKHLKLDEINLIFTRNLLSDNPNYYEEFYQYQGEHLFEAIKPKEFLENIKKTSNKNILEFMKCLYNSNQKTELEINNLLELEKQIKLYINELKTERQENQAIKRSLRIFNLETLCQTIQEITY